MKELETDKKTGTKYLREKDERGRRRRRLSFMNKEIEKINRKQTENARR